MNFLKNRALAAGVLAAVVLFLTPLGAARSLQKAVDDVEEQFYTGVGAAGAVNDYLADAARAALGLVTVGAHYDGLSGETGALRAAREALLAADGSITKTREANLDLRAAFNNLRAALTSMTLSDYDADSVEEYARLFDGAEGAISHSGYREAVEAFMDGIYGRFPASLIGALFSVEPPESFE